MIRLTSTNSSPFIMLSMIIVSFFFLLKFIFICCSKCNPSICLCPATSETLETRFLSKSTHLNFLLGKEKHVADFISKLTSMFRFYTIFHSRKNILYFCFNSSLQVCQLFQFPILVFSNSCRSL
jgi:hypothetical protein